MKDLRGRVAAITGSGSGIGRALAVALATEGCHLALSDVDAIGLSETVAMCEGHGIKVSSQRVDVADRNAMFTWAEQVVADHGRVNLIFNNAGVALSYTVESMSIEDLEWLMGVNFWGVVYGTKAFLPHLAASGEGHIVNVSSIFGLIGIPSQSAYNAAKFAVRGFTDALRIELKSERSPVSCTTVHPGGVKTNIVRNARLDPETVQSQTEDPGVAFQRIAMTTPQDAAKTILTAVRKDRRRVLIGNDAKVIDLLARLPAGFYHWPMILGGRLAARRSKSQRSIASGPPG
jgi:NAD(P)-dependent dehydrogenase (short-subunit alcohol dehydrogenase family)